MALASSTYLGVHRDPYYGVGAEGVVVEVGADDFRGTDLGHPLLQLLRVALVVEEVDDHVGIVTRLGSPLRARDLGYGERLCHELRISYPKLSQELPADLDQVVAGLDGAFITEVAED